MDAQFNLGGMYANGQGVQKDDTKLVEWYSKAAAQGYAPAQNNLGIMYEYGRSVKKDDVNALIALLQRHTRELRDKLREDKEFAEAAFLYEMDNHEYAINWSADEDVMDCFSIDWQMLRDWGLEDAYRRARNQHMKHGDAQPRHTALCNPR